MIFLTTPYHPFIDYLLITLKTLVSLYKLKIIVFKNTYMKTTKVQYIVQLLIWLLFWVGVATFVGYCAVCIFLFFQQPRFLFFPSAEIETTPKAWKLDYEEVWLPVPVASKLERIHGWWIKANHKSDRVLLYLHGNGINIGANVAHANRLQKLGFSILLIDYRGYGRSEGAFPNEARVYQDAATAWNYLVEHKGIDPKNIFIYGHSLGGAIAIDLAVQHPDAAGLIVESSFTSIQGVIAARKLFRIFPVSFILTQRFDSLNKVAKLKMPVLFIHGTADETVPAFMSQNLYDAASEPKQLILVPGAGHNNVADVAPDIYLPAVRSFINQFYGK